MNIAGLLIMWAICMITLVGCLLLCIKIKISSRDPASVAAKKKKITEKDANKTEKADLESQLKDLKLKKSESTAQMTKSSTTIAVESANGTSQYPVTPATKKINIKDFVREHVNMMNEQRNQSSTYDI